MGNTKYILANSVAWASILIGLFSACTQPTSSQLDSQFDEAEKIISKMIVPTFCADTFNIVDFGADNNIGAIQNQKAIQSAIDKASENGGGCVLIPTGEWITGPLTLKSNTNLIVSENAVLKFSTDYSHYYPAVETRWEGLDCYNAHPLIYALNAKNIAITGKGTIDGQGSNEVWWFMKGRKIYGWHEGLISQTLGGRDTLISHDIHRTPIVNRQMTLKDGLRPQLINICKSENVLIQDVTLRNSPFWVIHPLFVKDLTVKGVRIESHGPNSDGCDPESCENVLIEDCFFDTGDDCIAIKSGRNYDGREHNTPSKNVIVRNCRMKNGHGGVVVGSEISGGFQNLWVENCQMDSPELERVIRIKTSNCRGGVIENIFVRNIEVGQCQESILKVNLEYEPDEPCNRNFPPMVLNVNLENVKSQKSKYGVYVVGLQDSPENVDGIHLFNCQFNGVESDNYKISNAQNISFESSTINGTPLKYQ